MSDPQDPNEARYQAILRKLATRRPFGTTPPAPTPAMGLLDQINAYDALSAAKDHASLARCYGPKVCHGPHWAGVVLWRPGQGYYGYQQLTLAGIWALLNGDESLLLAGKRYLAYQAAIYDPEAYHQLIKKQFNLYYDDAGQPPTTAQASWVARYHPQERIALRDQLNSALRQLLAAL